MDHLRIRNFSIIAHIDHGKSTLADRFLELTGALRPREMESQVLDSMDLERERGITIKAQTVRLSYTAADGQTYTLNLIDTPGHVDFSYEVTRSLVACEGALLLVDSAQGVEAQTVANAYLAVDHNLEIIPIVNKIDLPGAQVEETARQIKEFVGLDSSTAIQASAKEGIGIREILEAVVERFPPPQGVSDAPLKALIFDSWYDEYRGVVVLIRVVDGVIRRKTTIRLMAADKNYEVEQVGDVHTETAYCRRTRRWRGRFRHRWHQAAQRRQDWRHDYRGRETNCGTVPRLQGSKTDGLCRTLSGRRPSIS